MTTTTEHHSLVPQQQQERSLLGLNDQSILKDTPRFGHSNNFAQLFSSDMEERNDYIIGISVVALTLTCFFVVWLFLLMIWKCLGARRVGFLSGSPYQATHQDGTINRRPTRGRVAFVISGIGFITFAMLVVFIGIPGLESTSGEITEGAMLGRDLMVDVLSLTARFLMSSQATLQQRAAVLDALEGVFQPQMTVPPNTLIVVEGVNATNATTTSAFVSSAFVYNDIDLQELARQAMVSVEGVNPEVEHKTQDLSNLVQDGEDSCGDIETVAGTVDMTTLQINLGVPSVVLPGILMLLFLPLAAWQRTNSCLLCCTSWFVLPLFILFILFLIVMTAISSISGILNADFCSGGEDVTPDSTVLEILLASGVDPTSFAYRSTQYIVRGCNDMATADFAAAQQEYPLDFLEYFESNLTASVESVQLIVDSIEEIGVDQLAENLEVDDIVAVQSAMDSFQQSAMVTRSDVTDVLNGLVCTRLYEIYSKIAHEAACDYTGILWTFYGFLAMAFFGCLMLTFRATLYPVVVVTTQDDEDGLMVVGEEAQQLDKKSDGTGEEEEPESSGDDNEENEAFLDEPEDEMEYDATAWT